MKRRNIQKPDKIQIHARYTKKRSAMGRIRKKILNSRVPPSSGNNIQELDKIAIKLKEIFKKHPQVISVYIYGSIGTKYVHGKSDIDLFIIMKDHHDPIGLIKKLVSDVKELDLRRGIDFDICFESETKHFLHRGSAQLQYIAIGRTGRLVYGKPILRNVPFSMKEFYLSVAALSQKIRHEIVNKFNEYQSFHFRKGILFMVGSLAYENPKRQNFHPIENMHYVFQKHPSLRKFRTIIMSKTSTLEEQWQVAEALRKIVASKLRKNRMA